MTQRTPKGYYPSSADWVVGFLVVCGCASVFLAIGLLVDMLLSGPRYGEQIGAQEIVYAISHAAGWIIVVISWLSVPILILLRRIYAILDYRHAVLVNSISQAHTAATAGATPPSPVASPAPTNPRHPAHASTRQS